MQLFSPSKNEKLLAYVAEVGDSDIRILTKYPLEYIPGLEGFKVSYNFSDFGTFLEFVNRPDINHIFVQRYADKEILDYIEDKLEKGDYELIFEDKEWIPYKFIYIKQK